MLILLYQVKNKKSMRPLGDCVAFCDAKCLPPWLHFAMQNAPIARRAHGRQNVNKRILKFSQEKLAFCTFYKVPIRV